MDTYRKQKINTNPFSNTLIRLSLMIYLVKKSLLMHLAFSIKSKCSMSLLCTGINVRILPSEQLNICTVCIIYSTEMNAAWQRKYRKKYISTVSVHKIKLDHHKPVTSLSTSWQHKSNICCSLTMHECNWSPIVENRIMNLCHKLTSLGCSYQVL